MASAGKRPPQYAPFASLTAGEPVKAKGKGNRPTFTPYRGNTAQHKDELLEVHVTLFDFHGNPTVMRFLRIYERDNERMQ